MYSEIQKLLLLEVERCIARLEQHCNKSFQFDGVRFNLRGRAAGQFRVKLKNPANRWPSKPSGYTKELRFNQQLLEHYGERFIRETVGHEVCHFVVFELYGKKARPHGNEWQYLMKQVLGQNPTVTHSYDVESAVKRPKFDYSCACPDKTHKLGAIRHQRVIAKQASYLCRACKQSLVVT